MIDTCNHCNYWIWFLWTRLYVVIVFICLVLLNCQISSILIFKSNVHYFLYLFWLYLILSYYERENGILYMWRSNILTTFNNYQLKLRTTIRRTLQYHTFSTINSITVEDILARFLYIVVKILRRFYLVLFFTVTISTTHFIEMYSFTFYWYVFLHLFYCHLFL